MKYNAVLLQPSQPSLLTRSIWLEIRHQQCACITYVTFTYIFPFGLCGCLLKYRLHSLTDPAPCISTQNRRGTLLHWENTQQNREKGSVQCVTEDKNTPPSNNRYALVLLNIFLRLLSEKTHASQAHFKLLNVVQITVLTRSIEHHEDGPLLPLQHLPEILRD